MYHCVLATARCFQGLIGWTRSCFGRFNISRLVWVPSLTQSPCPEVMFGYANAINYATTIAVSRVSRSRPAYPGKVG